jgi:hypothetical protein
VRLLGARATTPSKAQPATANWDQVLHEMKGIERPPAQPASARMLSH